MGNAPKPIIVAKAGLCNDNPVIILETLKKIMSSDPYKKKHQQENNVENSSKYIVFQNF